MSAVDVFRHKQLENSLSCPDNYINIFVKTNPYHLVTQGPFLQYFVLQNENICCYCEPSDIVLSSAKQLSVVPHHLDAQCMHKQKHNKTPTCFRKRIQETSKNQKANLRAAFVIFCSICESVSIIGRSGSYRIDPVKTL